MPGRAPVAVGLLIGYAADLVVADPRRGHPVAGFGRCVGLLERSVYADRRDRGGFFVLGSAGTATATAVLAVRGARAVAPGAATRAALTAAVTWAVLGGASLGRTASLLATTLQRGDLDSARSLLPSLCGRDASALDGSELARATVESVAENTSDALVAPLLWGALAGVPGLVGYRAVNTLDAMVGHRSPRYRNFGWAAARLDDLVNLVPARITGALAVACAPVVGGSSRAAYAVLHRDGDRHPSPNAGRCEAAFAGALGLRLGGTNVYGGRAEHRPVLGRGRVPGPDDVRRAVRLARTVGLLAAVLAVAISSLRECATRETP